MKLGKAENYVSILKNFNNLSEVLTIVFKGKERYGVYLYGSRKDFVEKTIKSFIKDVDIFEIKGMTIIEENVIQEKYFIDNKYDIDEKNVQGVLLLNKNEINLFEEKELDDISLLLFEHEFDGVRF